MHYKFDQNYVRRSCQSVAMIVLNRVVIDSRVLKTAQTVAKLGYKLHVYGLNNTDAREIIEGHPFKITLLPNPVFEMAKLKLPTSKQNLDHKSFIDIFVRDLEKEFVSAPPDLLHTHDMHGLAVGGKLLEGTDKKFLWIHDIHEYVKGLTDLPAHTRKYFYSIEKRYIHIPQALTSISPTLNKILTNKYHLKSLSLVLNTPRLSDFDPYYQDIRSVLGLDPTAPLLVYAGNVKPVRGIKTLIEALPLIPEAHLVLVSNNTGSYVDELKTLAQSLGAEKRLHFHPYVPFNKVTSFIRTANIGIHPIERYPNAEIALPNKLFEYVHAGLPMVVSNNGTMKDFVTRHDSGTVFKAGNAASLARAVKLELERQGQNIACCAAIRALAEEYSWENQEKTIAALYNKLDRPQKTMVTNRKLRTLRIFELPSGNAGQPVQIAAAIRQKGLSASSLTISQNWFGYKTDLLLEKEPKDIARHENLIKDLMAQYDVFHYHVRPLIYFKGHLFPTGIDMLTLRGAGKKIFFHFRGSEARLASVFAKTPYNYVEENPNDIFNKFVEKNQRVFMKYVEGVSHGVFAADPEIQTYVPAALIVPRVINLAEWPNVGVNPAGKLKIVHAPSSPALKGTESVLKAIERLSAEGVPIEFKLVENMNHEEAKEVYKWADVVVDQLRIGWYGVLSVEAMALGKAVVTYIRDDLKHYLPHPAPLAIANPDTIYDVLKDLAQNKKEAVALGRRGRKYTAEIHDAQKVTDVLLQIYETKNAPLEAAGILEMFAFQQYKLNKLMKKKAKRINYWRFLKIMNQANLLLLWREIQKHGVALAARKAYHYFLKIKNKMA